MVLKECLKKIGIRLRYYQQRGGQVQSSGKGTVDQIVHGETIDQNLEAKKLQLKALQ